MSAHSRWPTAWLVSVVFAVLTSLPAQAAGQTVQVYKRALDQAQRRRLYQVIADSTEAIRLNLKDADAYINRGRAYSEKDEFDRAIRDFTGVIRINPNDVDAYGNRGAAYVEKGEFDQAIGDFTEVIRLNPKEAEPYMYRGDAWRAKCEQANTSADHRQAELLKQKP